VTPRIYADVTNVTSGGKTTLGAALLGDRVQALVQGVDITEIVEPR
jgi:hypothetical protein